MLEAHKPTRAFVAADVLSHGLLTHRTATLIANGSFSILATCDDSAAAVQSVEKGQLVPRPKYKFEVRKLG